MAAALVTLLGCAERHPSGTVAFQLASRHVAMPGLSDSTIVALGRDSIIIRSAQVVLTEIQLAPTGSGDCDPEEAEEERCAQLEVGPALITLPLSDRAVTLATVPVSVGTYIVFHFALFPPDSGPDAGTSVRVQGTFSRAGKRAPFVYSSDFQEQHETGLLPPLAVHAGDTAHVTLRLDVATWFVSADKATLIDPATANRDGPNRALVHDNIRTSVAAFRDDNQDGFEDGVDDAFVSPWPAGLDSAATMSLRPCRRQVPRITSDSIGPFRMDQSVSELERQCSPTARPPQLRYGWQPDPDGFAVPTVTARLGKALVTALLTDTLPSATVREVVLADAGPSTVHGVGVGSTLRELQRAYGTPGASESDCVLRIWFTSLPGVAFRMEFPGRERRECGGLSETPLPPDLRVATVVLVPR